MTISDFDLADFVNEVQADEEWAELWARQVLTFLNQAETESRTGWLAAIQELRDNFDQQLWRSEVRYETAAHVWFILDLLQAVSAERKGHLRQVVLSVVRNLALSAEEWKRESSSFDFDVPKATLWV